MVGVSPRERNPHGTAHRECSVAQRASGRRGSRRRRRHRTFAPVVLPALCVAEVSVAAVTVAGNRTSAPSGRTRAAPPASTRSRTSNVEHHPGPNTPAGRAGSESYARTRRRGRVPSRSTSVTNANDPPLARSIAPSPTVVPSAPRAQRSGWRRAAASRVASVAGSAAGSVIKVHRPLRVGDELGGRREGHGVLGARIDEQAGALVKRGRRVSRSSAPALTSHRHPALPPGPAPCRSANDSASSGVVKAHTKRGPGSPPTGYRNDTAIPSASTATRNRVCRSARAKAGGGGTAEALLEGADLLGDRGGRRGHRNVPLPGSGVVRAAGSVGAGEGLGQA